MSKNKESGNIGEKEVIRLIKCPNCGRKLMLMPPSFPLVDVQCTGCNFRAQIKTNNSKPKDEIFGAGWEIYNKVFKAGFLLPPLIVNFKWDDHQEIILYPFIPQENLKKRILPITARRANYKMFNYIGLKKLPKFTLYKK